MRIISIHVYKCTSEDPIQLACTYELGFVSIFQRGTLKEFINFNSRLVAGYLNLILVVLHQKRD